ncbi:hypothetical protein NDU88_002691 [Pleurodeles waltl]|uniref:Uncharacterized protein n=1 Tax=Pleurodeles waltl TaxID=8319 RepID=A0AAV7NIF1_PLEWA|nr:hypothetical protein NDU88_002691 [Pleurodeles waltl]
MVQAEIREQITLFLQTNDTPDISHSLLGQTLKSVLRSSVIAISARFNALWQEKHTELEHRLKNLDAWHKQTGAWSGWKQLSVARKELKALDYHKAEYSLLQVRQKNFTGSNKADQLLVCKLQAKKSRERVVWILGSDGTEAQMDEAFAQEFELFYPTLHSSDQCEQLAVTQYLSGSRVTLLPP